MMKKMMFMLIWVMGAVFLVTAFTTTSVMATNTSTTQQQQTEKTILQSLKADGRFNTFAALIEAAALADNLDQDGPFTVFAPTDEAFAAFEEQAESSPASLTDILLYHVINGSYLSPAVASRSSLPTLSGQSIEIYIQDGAVVLNDTIPVVEADIVATNGVIHVVETVLTPSSEIIGDDTLTIVEVLEADGRFTTLLTALAASGLDTMLVGPGNFTFFAPTDDAFAVLSPKQLQEWLDNPEGDLKTILHYHLVGDELNINQIATDDYIPTLDGRPLIVTTDTNLQVFLNGHSITTADIHANNGLIHAVDAVLLP